MWSDWETLRNWGAYEAICWSQHSCDVYPFKVHGSAFVLKYLLDAVRLKSFDITSTITNLYEYVSLLIWSLPSSDHVNNAFRQGRDETATKDSDSSFNHRVANRSGEIDAWAALSKNEERVESKLLEDEKAVWEVWVIKKKGKRLAIFFVGRKRINEMWEFTSWVPLPSVISRLAW